MPPPHKPILCLDFDGVVHSYERGWQNGEIYGSVTPGFFEWATVASHHFQLVIYSSRSSYDSGREKMKRWMEDQAALQDAPKIPFEYSSKKPSAFLTIDDRALTFDGNWGDQRWSPSSLLSFKPWNTEASTSIPPPATSLPPRQTESPQ